MVDGIDPKDWTPRELRHSFVSMFSDNGVAIEEIARLAGHSNSRTTEVVYASSPAGTAHWRDRHGRHRQ